ncbi:MAG TPA: hypothetical protein VH817_22370, partial [Thermoleophilaceae bacterium]
SMLSRMLAREARVAWGILDPVTPTSAADAAEIGAAALAAVTCRQLPARRVAQLSLLTPTCGTGRLSPTRERLVATSLREAAEAIQRAGSERELPPISGCGEREAA